MTITNDIIIGILKEPSINPGKFKSFLGYCTMILLIPKNKYLLINDDDLINLSRLPKEAPIFWWKNPEEDIESYYIIKYPVSINTIPFSLSIPYNNFWKTYYKKDIEEFLDIFIKEKIL